MKTKIITVFLLATSGLVPAGLGQSPTTPAPSVQDAPLAPAAPVAPASPMVDSPTGAPPPNHVVYTAQLPSVEDLTNAATAKGTTISRVDQTSSEITISYQHANGQVNVVAYRLLSDTGNSRSVPVVTRPSPPVVHVPRTRVVYYDSYRSYDPWYWYPPVSLSIGLGFHHGHHHSWHHRGGYHRGGHGHRYHHRHR
jgi:hypothetical protein